jgi:hypothetical protein
MTDTSADVEREYRRRLLERPGAERLKMGCSMFTTALVFVRAAIRTAGLSPSGERRALFERLYGTDFAPADRERIAAGLGQGETGSPPDGR